MNTNYDNVTLLSYNAQMKRLKQEKEEFSELIDGVEKISTGFLKIAKFLKSAQSKLIDERIDDLESDIKRLEKQLSNNDDG